MTWTWEKHVLKYWKKSNRFNTFMLILFYFSRQTKVETSRALHKKWSFPLRISSVNVTKSALSFGHGDCICMWRKKLCNCLSSLFPSSSCQCFKWICKIFLRMFQRLLPRMRVTKIALIAFTCKTKGFAIVFPFLLLLISVFEWSGKCFLLCFTYCYLGCVWPVPA